MFRKILLLSISLLGLCFFGLNNNVLAETNCVTATGTAAEGCLNSKDFFINTETITPGGKKFLGDKNATNSDGSRVLDGSTEKTVNAALGGIIKNLIVVFGVLALLIMTIGAGFMIFHTGQDGLLSRGKTIFTSGLIALAIALSSGLLVQLVAYLLY